MFRKSPDILFATSANPNNPVSLKDFAGKRENLDLRYLASLTMSTFKTLIKTIQILKYYDFKSPIKIKSGASQHGLGAALVQKYGEVWKPIIYASWAMTKSECHYVQIEKATLALVSAYKKERGECQFVAETDSKPLVSIFFTKII